MGEVAQRRDERVVTAPRAAGPPGDDDVHADVGRLGEQRHDGRHRVALARRNELVVVDDDERLAALPPRPGPQLLRRHVGARQARVEKLREPLDRIRRLVGSRAVFADPLVGELAEVGAPVVDDEQLRPGGAVEPHDLVHVGAQEGRLA